MDANAAALAAAITALTNDIALIRPPAPTAAVFDPFQEDQPYNLASRSGFQAYKDMSAPLDEIWDGTVAAFPSFVVSLRLRAEEGKWNAASPHGILTVDGQDILKDYHSITDTQVEAAQVARIDTRAIQNAACMYKCIKSSIKGDIRDTIFTQIGNIPTIADGVALFKKSTTFTSVASLQLSMLSFNSILSFNPFEHSFNIPTINSKLMHLFVLATTQHRNLDESERIQHTLNAYTKILQPEVWAQWVRNKLDSFEDGNITVCQDFMNSATIKYNKIAATEGGFKGSVHSVQEDIVALFATKAKSNNNKRKAEDVDNTNPKFKKSKTNTPPWITHFEKNGVKYKVGDSKDFNGKTFYFCDAPIHRDKIKWHTHKHDVCRVRKIWIKKEAEGKSDNAPPAEANITEAEEDTVSTVTPENSVNSADIHALLASAMNLVTDNDVVRDYIAEAINAANNE